MPEDKNLLDENNNISKRLVGNKTVSELKEWVIT